MRWPFSNKEAKLARQIFPHDKQVPPISVTNERHFGILSTNEPITVEFLARKVAHNRTKKVGRDGMSSIPYDLWLQFLAKGKTRFPPFLYLPITLGGVRWMVLMHTIRSLVMAASLYRHTMKQALPVWIQVSHVRSIADQASHALTVLLLPMETIGVWKILLIDTSSIMVHYETSMYLAFLDSIEQAVFEGAQKVQSIMGGTVDIDLVTCNAMLQVETPICVPASVFFALEILELGAEGWAAFTKTPSERRGLFGTDIPWCLFTEKLANDQRRTVLARIRKLNDMVLRQVSAWLKGVDLKEHGNVLLPSTHFLSDLLIREHTIRTWDTNQKEFSQVFDGRGKFLTLKPGRNKKT